MAIDCEALVILRGISPYRQHCGSLWLIPSSFLSPTCSANMQSPHSIEKIALPMYCVPVMGTGPRVSSLLTEAQPQHQKPSKLLFPPRPHFERPTQYSTQIAPTSTSPISMASPSPTRSALAIHGIHHAACGSACGAHVASGACISANSSAQLIDWTGVPVPASKTARASSRIPAPCRPL